MKITYLMFAKTLTNISANETLYFTPKQLLYFLDNRLRKKWKQSLTPLSLVVSYIMFGVSITVILGGVTRAFLPHSFIVCNLIYQGIAIFYLFKSRTSSKYNNTTRQASGRFLKILGILIIIVGTLVSILINSIPIFCTVIILGILSIYLGNKWVTKVENLPQKFLVTQSYVDDLLKEWEAANGKVEKVLPEPKNQIKPASINPDVTAYSFDRLVVCDSANIAQLLIANNFHFENNCAILSINGYPQSIFNTTMKMLRRNPNLQVFTIHDSSPQGVSLVHHLRTSEMWFLNSDVTIIDVGLLPRQIINNHREIFIINDSASAKKSKELPLEIRQNLTKEELKWLNAGNFVELESFSPQMLIKVLRSGISGSLNLTTGDDSSFLLVDDTGNDIYVVESFG
ncbi:hypothetical protein [Anabaena sphaerica]|uniref:hypothetical protein n=1 Tax=Anabaena sphaerica TaxID=212446 RepID=UPI001F55076E|nr:hypothetical protein [Anabaena sphaerica]